MIRGRVTEAKFRAQQLSCPYNEEMTMRRGSRHAGRQQQGSPFVCGQAEGAGKQNRFKGGDAVGSTAHTSEGNREGGAVYGVKSVWFQRRGWVPIPLEKK